MKLFCLLTLFALIPFQILAEPRKKKSSNASPIQNQETVCEYASRIGKKDFSKMLSISKTATYESELRKLFSVDAFAEVDKQFSLVGTDAIDITKIDLNKDGTMDYVLHRKEGSIQCGAVAVLLGKKDFNVQIAGVPDFNTCELNTGIFNHKNKNYLVFSTNNEMSIQELKNNTLSEICGL